MCFILGSSCKFVNYYYNSFYNASTNNYVISMVTVIVNNSRNLHYLLHCWMYIHKHIGIQLFNACQLQLSILGAYN